MTIPAQYAAQVAERQKTFPVNVIGLAEDLEINVLESEQFADNQSGIIGMGDDNKPFIVVNRKHPATRQMFTIAHELGHFMAHKMQLEHQQIPVAGITRVLKREDGPKSAEERVMEAEANELAAEILMPADAFKLAWEKNKGSEDVLTIVAQQFGVSPAAANVRASRVIGEFVV